MARNRPRPQSEVNQGKNFNFSRKPNLTDTFLNIFLGDILLLVLMTNIDLDRFLQLSTYGQSVDIVPQGSPLGEFPKVTRRSLLLFEEKIASFPSCFRSSHLGRRSIEPVDFWAAAKTLDVLYILFADLAKLIFSRRDFSLSEKAPIAFAVFASQTQAT